MTRCAPNIESTLFRAGARLLAAGRVYSFVAGTASRPGRRETALTSSKLSSSQVKAIPSRKSLVGGKDGGSARGGGPRGHRGIGRRGVDARGGVP